VPCNAGPMYSPTAQLLTMHCVRAGGRGKSTLAKVLFNRLAGGFPHSAFVEIQEGESADKTAGHVAKALDDLGGAQGNTLHGFVRDRKVLLVLDNVWTASQLTALLPTAWGAGSTVIVTSRSAGFTDSDAWRRVRPFTNCYWSRDCTVTACVHGCVRDCVDDNAMLCQEPHTVPLQRARVALVTFLVQLASPFTCLGAVGKQQHQEQHHMWAQVWIQSRGALGPFTQRCTDSL
jgi:hypothetical protein